MVAITYIEHGGESHSIEVEEDMSLMEGAVLNMIPGIEGMCGGICSCATCHCYIDLADHNRLAKMSDGESEMLDALEDRRSESRLACQVSVSEELNGLRVYLPKSQN